MFEEGDRVCHKSKKVSFGIGTVRKINTEASTALVDWDSHEVTRETERLTKQQSHVYLDSLTKV